MFRQFSTLSSHVVRRFSSNLRSTRATVPFSTPHTTAPGRFYATNNTKNSIATQYPRFMASYMNNQHQVTGTLATTYFNQPIIPTIVFAGVGVATKQEGCPLHNYGYDINGYTKDYVAQVRAAEPQIRQAILDTIEDENGDYDGHGSYAPIYLRLAWHSSGTYDKSTNTGGSNGGCMRFQPEAGHGANAGLNIARDRLESVKQKFPFISYADLYSLAGVVSAEAMNDEMKVKWRPGRSDYSENKHYQVDRIRLPDGMQGASHIRDVFTNQMGFNDREIVALIGSHAVGLVHSDRSGFLTRPWTYSPTTLSNSFFTTLLNENWTLVDGPNGTKHYRNDKDELIMIPADYAFILDPEFLKYVHEYAQDEQKWVQDFSAAFTKLLELGVPFVPE